MLPSLGFVILSHNQPGQVLRLASTLNRMFDRPPIACHHDSSETPIDKCGFPPNLQFVEPHIVTEWGGISVPLAAIKALELLAQASDPDWYVLLSGSDYPVRTQHQILQDLYDSGYDLYLDYREIRRGVIPREQTATDGGFGRPSYIDIAFERYCTFRFRCPWPSTKKLAAGKLPLGVKHLVVRNARLGELFQRFYLKSPMRIYAGDFWFQASRKAVMRLLNNPWRHRLARYYRGRPNADESFLHTLLCNEPDLSISKNNKRYEDWPVDAWHPRVLNIDDVPQITRSGAHFARKFSPDGLSQDFLDQFVLGLEG